MAILFLTSSPTGPLDGSRPVIGFDKMNNFVEKLRSEWKENSRCLIVAATPDAYAANDQMTDFFREALLTDGFSLTTMDLLDERYQDMSREHIQGYDVILLGGGHVPTENAFFQRIGLREKIRDFAGIIIGISAGSMNSADLVYCQPEEQGEAADQDFIRWITGLGFTRQMIIPHYQMVADKLIDGQHLFRDIAIPDSRHRTFIALTDGAYIFSKNGEERVYGEAYIIQNGSMRKLCDTDDWIEI